MNSSVGSIHRLEFPTLILSIVIYTSWFLVTFYFNSLTIWFTLPLAAFVTAWHSSLQHETIHGHLTNYQWLNDLIGYLPLGLIYPYPLYKRSHLDHHETEHLTHPIEDPESYYVTVKEWNRIRPLSRLLLRIHNTALGRLVLGPTIAMIRFFRMEYFLLKSGNRSHLKAWGIHLLLCSLILTWVTLFCGISLLEYFLFFAYPGMSLILLRSFAEHRPHTSGNARRSALVESEALFRLLYLGNNYHHLHHKAPGIPWYRLHNIYQQQRERLISENGTYLFRGYREILLKYALIPKEDPIHPHHG